MLRLQRYHTAYLGPKIIAPIFVPILIQTGAPENPIPAGAKAWNV
jgi:hypothetical protein